MKTIIIDGHNLCWRIAKRLPILTANGKPVQVVYGALNAIHGMLAQFQPDVGIVCWDTGHSAYRKQKFPEYKAHRHQHFTKEEEKQFQSTITQIEECQRVLRQLNLSQLYFPQTEADDLIAMICQEKALNGQRIVVSSDMDMFQLVQENTSVWSPIKTQLYTHGNFRQKVGLTPHQFLQLRAAIGDGSDNIPGIAKGLGETTIRELLASYKDMEELFTPEVEKKVYKRGNRYRLLYGKGVRERYYLNLMLMDLSVSSYNHPEEKKVRRVVFEAVRQRGKIDKAEITRYFISKSFQSLLKNFAQWITPFEELDTK
jgi:DNA polymerase-1